jgi:protein involved in polysaccharide export with SLBB domain
MLKKFKSSVFLLLILASSSSVYGQAFTPNPQQIEQFKNMSRAEQEVLARQMGIDLSTISLPGSNTVQVQEESRVERNVDANSVSQRLAEQSASQSKTAKLKPFGYELFTSSSASFSPATNMPVPADYLMGPGDSIRVQLFGKESAQFELQVSNEGLIQVPNLGPMSAVGLNYSELKKQLIKRYNEQVIGVTPTISMGELRTIQVYIVGEAYQPGAYVVSALSSITNALFASGGVNEVGSLRHIELKRGGKTISEFDLYDLLVFGRTAQDMRLQQGDVIFIPIVKKLVSIDGSVRRPAIYEAKDNDDMASMVNIAGGLLPTASASSLQIARSTPAQGLQVNTVDMQTKAGREFSLESGDFINVPAASNEFSNAVLILGAYATPGLTQWTANLKLSKLIDKHSLLNTSDVDYALVIRGDKFARQSEVIQFEPAKVLSGAYDLALQAFDKVVLFNRFTPIKPEPEVPDWMKQGQYAQQNGVRSQEGGSNIAKYDTTLRDQPPMRKRNNNADEDELADQEPNYLQKLELASFTEKYLILNETKYYSREELLEPIITRLQNESTQSSPVKLVEITGQVKFPGIYPVQKNAKVRELLLAGGGLLESAYLQKAEISRTALDTNNALKIQHIEIDLVDTLLGQSTTNITLQSKDTLNVLRTPDWQENKKVELLGKVVFPGTYQIKKGETLAQLIKRAGGLTSDATVKAAIFTREELKEREKENRDRAVENLRQQIASTNFTGSQNVKTIDYQEASLILDELLLVEPVGRLVIDLPALIAGNPSADITLKDGDKVFVPNISSSVSVVGEVFVPTTHMFTQGLALDNYIQYSGGVTERADNSHIYIVKADGSVAIPNNSFWFNTQELILEPGDTIVVPRDVTNYERLGLWQTITQIAYQSAIALIAIGNL